MKKLNYISNARLLLCLLCFYQGSTGQSNHYSVKTYTAKDGLTDQITHNIYQDVKAFIWVSTYKGLDRFDGKNFVNHGFRQGLTQFSAGKVLEDDQGRFWVNIADNVFEFSNNRFISYPFDDSSAHHGYIYSLNQLKNGELWIQTHQGSFLFNKNYWKKKPLIQGYENRICRQICVTDQDTYFNFGNAIVKKGKDNKVVELISHKSEGDVYFNNIYYKNGKLYTSTFKDIFELTADGKLVPLFKGKLPKGGWFDFFIDSKKRFWMCRHSYRMIYVAAPGNTDHFSDSIPVKGTLFTNFFEDRDHNIWLTSDRGLLKIQEQVLSHYSRETNPLIDDIRNIMEAPDGSLYVFSREQGILQFNGHDFEKAGFQFYANNPKAKNDFPDSYFKDEQDRIWFATRDRRIYRLENNKLLDCSNLLPEIHDLFWITRNPKTGKIFFSLDTLKTLIGNEALFFTSRNKKAGLSKPRNAFGFANGRTLFYCPYEDFVLIDEQDNAFNISNNLGLWAMPGTSFLEDGNKGFWMYGGNYGLRHYYWNNNNLPENNYSITSENGLLSDAIIAACMDNHGNIWAATSKGLMVFTIDKSSNNIRINQLSDHSNMGSEVSNNAKLMTSKTGNIWFINENDIYAFNPDDITFIPTKPAISIEEIQVNFKKTNWENYTGSFTGFWHLPQNPVLPYNNNNLQFSFTGISFVSSSDLLYSYKLEGLDTGWSIASKSSFVNFVNLPSANYIFNVKAKTINSDWCTPTTFAFIIKKPFWETWWFRLFMIGFAQLLVVYLYRRSVKRVEQKAGLQQRMNELKMTALKAQMNPHFIYNALNSIQALVAEGKEDEAIHYIGSFSRLLRQVLEQAESNVISLERELEMLDRYIGLEKLRLSITFNYTLDIDDAINTSAEKIPPLTLQPFVENALWHGLNKKEGEKLLRIAITANESWLFINIHDNGIGRNTAKLSAKKQPDHTTSKGITITQNRMADFNQTTEPLPVMIEDLFDEKGLASGTCIRLQLKR